MSVRSFVAQDSFPQFSSYFQQCWWFARDSDFTKGWRERFWRLSSVHLVKRLSSRDAANQCQGNDGKSSERGRSRRPRRSPSPVVDSRRMCRSNEHPDPHQPAFLSRQTSCRPPLRRRWAVSKPPSQLWARTQTRRCWRHSRTLSKQHGQSPVRLQWGCVWIAGETSSRQGRGGFQPGSGRESEAGSRTLRGFGAIGNVACRSSRSRSTPTTSCSESGNPPSGRRIFSEETACSTQYSVGDPECFVNASVRLRHVHGSRPVHSVRIEDRSFQSRVGSPERRTRWGFRGVRVGEASDPAPPSFFSPLQDSHSPFLTAPASRGGLRRSGVRVSQLPTFGRCGIWCGEWRASGRHSVGCVGIRPHSEWWRRACSIHASWGWERHRESDWQPTTEPYRCRGSRGRT